jgi:CDP-diacylglycerol--glycerol-3-phosphate 3-phosphatidyltransferase
MNLPNKLTITRIILIPFVLFFMLPLSFLSAESAYNVFIHDYGMIIAVFLFGFASITDTMDGQIARRRGIVTTMGKFLDPIADKLLVTSVLIALVDLNKISAWVAIIVISREFIVTGIRLLAADKNVVISASKIGKLKTVVQIIAIVIIMLESQAELFFKGWAGLPYIATGANIILYLAVALTLVSGYDYLKKNLHFIKE